MVMAYPDNSYSDIGPKNIEIKTKYNYNHRKLASIISRTGLTVEFKEIVKFKKVSKREAIFRISSNGTTRQNAALKAFDEFFSLIGEHTPGQKPF